MCLPLRKGRFTHPKLKRSEASSKRLSLKRRSATSTGTVTAVVPRWASQPVVHRELSSPDGVELPIQRFTPPGANLADALPEDPDLERVDPGVSDYTQVPLVASRHLLEQADSYDLVGYIEDDLLLTDPEFFAKILYLDSCSGGRYAFLPHRCEHIPAKGDVILSGDPDGGRPDLFWDTGELNSPWPLAKVLLRATNP